MTLLRIVSNRVFIELKDFKGSKYNRLVAEVNLSSNSVLFQFENNMEVNTFTIYSEISNLIGSYGFGSDFKLNKRQSLWLKNNRKKLLDSKSSLVYEAMSMFNNPQLYKQGNKYE